MASQSAIKLTKLVERFELEVLNQGKNYDRCLIRADDINRPALQILGFFDYFAPDRIQVIGKVEWTYLNNQSPEERRKCFDAFLEKPIPALILTRSLEPFPELIRHYIELRGIGVVDIQQLFGMSAVREDQDINLVVNLEQWNDQVFYDRLGTNEEFTTILDMKIPAITIPIKPGRNLAIIVEVAAMNNRHKRMGYNAAQEFAKQLDAHFEQMMLSSQLDAADDYDEYESLSGEEEE